MIDSVPTATARLAVRDATAADAAACRAIYAPYVTDTAVTFELEIPSEAEVRRRIAEHQRGHAWLVAEDGGDLVGYAHAGPFASRPGYRWACVVSAYVDQVCRGRGLGTALYSALLERLAGRGHRGRDRPDHPAKRSQYRAA